MISNTLTIVRCVPALSCMFVRQTSSSRRRVFSVFAQNQLNNCSQFNQLNPRVLSTPFSSTTIFQCSQPPARLNIKTLKSEVLSTPTRFYYFDLNESKIDPSKRFVNIVCASNGKKSRIPVPIDFVSKLVNVVKELNTKAILADDITEENRKDFVEFFKSNDGKYEINVKQNNHGKYFTIVYEDNDLENKRMQLIFLDVLMVDRFLQKIEQATMDI